MASGDVNPGRRRILTIGTSVIGAVGGLVTAWPFIATMNPSAKALAAGTSVEVDLSKLEPGQKIQEEWRKRPVWIIRRTPEMVSSLTQNASRLRDPDSVDSIQPDFAKNAYRAAKEEYLVLIGICTHLGCSPLYKPEAGDGELGATWPGGFYCPCHGSRFDMSGRVYKNVPANRNLEVPPYQFVSDTRLIIGA